MSLCFFAAVFHLCSHFAPPKSLYVSLQTFCIPAVSLYPSEAIFHFCNRFVRSFAFGAVFFMHLHASFTLFFNAVLHLTLVTFYLSAVPSFCVIFRGILRVKLGASPRRLNIVLHISNDQPKFDHSKNG